MTRPDPARRPYLGYRGEDRAAPFARFFDDHMAPLADHVLQAVATGPVAPPLLAPLEALGEVVAADETPVETGLALAGQGDVRLAVRTPMPGVSPAMWDWWFGWHGSDTRRYKLWHPRAHLYAQWADGGDGERRGRARYVGRTSFVDEYIGSARQRVAITFVPAESLGVDPAAVADPEEATVVCARVGLSGQPVDLGWLAHHVRRTAEGAEMRSRFWMGGPHLGRRGGGGLPTALARRARPPLSTATALLVHCAQEMAHLAAFLPELHAAFGAD